MKTAIIYSSYHHGNTKKILDELVKLGDVTLFDASSGEEIPMLIHYDLVGFASGIYYSHFHEDVIAAAESAKMKYKQKTFLISTSGSEDNYDKEMLDLLKIHGSICLGSFTCKGYDTFGPFKLVGGIAKGHPNEDDLNAAVEFYKGLVAQVESENK